MKKEEAYVRHKRVFVRLNEGEYEKLKKFQQNSTDKNISTYLRRVAIQQPVTLFYRNASADDFLEQMLLIKQELNAIGNNFNQAVHKLHTLDRIPEFRNWSVKYETAHHQFLSKTDQLISIANQVYQLWLHE
ncbi:MAG: plasmid mobilization relaxosome protein MobC [Bacteroidota bacterium]